MRAEDLHDALRAAADRQAPAPGDLDAVRAGAQRRQRARARLVTGLCAVVLAGAGTSLALVAGSGTDDDDQVSVRDGDGSVRVPAGGPWEPLPAPPLGPRTQVVGVWTGSEVLLVGGSVFLCPPNATCDGIVQPLADGAILDLATTTWRAITPSPVPMSYAATAVLDGVVYFLLPITGQVLTYSIAGDTWLELPRPPGDPLRGLVATDRAVVAYAATDEGGEVPDQAYDPATGTWTPLPDDPRSPSFDRSLVWSAPHLYLFEHELVPNPGSTEPSLVRAARLDPGAGTWERLPDSEILGSPSWFVEGGLIVNPVLGGADGGEVNGWGRTYPYGGSFDTTAATWRPLAAPPGRDRPGQDVSNGVVGSADGLVFGAGDGLVLDAGSSMVWFEMPAAPGVGSEPYLRRTVVPAGRAAVAFGGEAWTSMTDGAALGDAWIWRAN